MPLAVKIPTSSIYPRRRSIVMVNTVLSRLVARSWPWRLRRSICVVVELDELRIPVNRGTGLHHLRGRPEIEATLRAVYRMRQGTFIDVGANIGQELLVLARLDRSIPYIGFEPLVHAAHYVQDLITENGLTDTHSVYAVALSDTVGAAKIMLNDETDVSASLSTELRPPSMYRMRIASAVTTGDIMLQGVDRIGAIKIDAEGHEQQVLRGLRQTIQRHRPIVILEIMPWSHLEQQTYDRGYFGELSDEQRHRLIANRQAHAAELERLFAEINYSLCRFDTAGVARRVSAQESTFERQDFVAIPGEDLHDA